MELQKAYKRVMKSMSEDEMIIYGDEQGWIK
jgi:hypothetical protein